MIKDITIGQYFPGNSVVHKMDARMKIIITLAMIVGIFLCKNFASIALIIITTFLFILLSKVPVKMVLKSVKPLAIIVAFTAVLNMFYINGGTTFFEWKFLHITSKGVYTALFMVVRIICLVIISSLLTYTTTPTTMTDAIERLLSPLKIIKVPVHTLTMMMTLALRFIPVLVDEIDRITNAQKARGADFDSGGLKEKVKALVPIIVPLFVSSIKHAFELADAMECRCYVDGKGRTRMKKMKLGVRDFVAFFVVAAIITGVVLGNMYFKTII